MVELTVLLAFGRLDQNAAAKIRFRFTDKRRQDKTVALNKTDCHR